MSEFANKSRGQRRQSGSLFGPLLLIAAGGYFLLRNLGWMPASLHWLALVQLWPLLLVFLGVNLIVQQAPRPLGSFLSGLVGLVAIGVFGYVLLFGAGHPLLQRMGVSEEAVGWKQDRVVFAREGVKTAVIHLNLASPGAHIAALSDSPNLIEGDIRYLGELDFGTEMRAGEADISLNTRNSPEQWLNPDNWNNENSEPWQIGLSPSVPLDLTLDGGSGSSEFDLSKLELEALALDGGSGSMNVALPGGAYTVDLNGGNGRVALTVPENGGQAIQVDGGSGLTILYLPDSVEARIAFHGGSGSLDTADRFELVQGDRDDGVWETAVYGNAPHQVEITIDGGSGSVRVVDQ